MILAKVPDCSEGTSGGGGERLAGTELDPPDSEFEQRPGFVLSVLVSATNLQSLCDSVHVMMLVLGLDIESRGRNIV